VRPVIADEIYEPHATSAGWSLIGVPSASRRVHAVVRLPTPRRTRLLPFGGRSVSEPAGFGLGVTPVLVVVDLRGARELHLE
jgi:hypothetical protein